MRRSSFGWSVICGAVVGLWALMLEPTGVRAAGLIAVPGPNSPPTARCSVVCYYVDAVHGSDANTGRSRSAAFATLDKASSKVVPGATVYVMSGTYSADDSSAATLTITTAGRPNAWITFAAYPGQHPIVKLDPQAWNGIHLIGAAAYILIEGFEVAGLQATVVPGQALANPLGEGLFNENGIYSDGYTDNTVVHHIVVRDNYVHDCSGGGIVSNQADYLTFDNNTVVRNAFWSGYASSGISIYHSTDIDHVTSYKNYVVANIVYGNREYIPFQFVTPPAITDGNGIIIDDNKHTQDNVAPYNGRTYVANNLTYANGGRGVHVFSSRHVDVANNTTYEDMQSPQIATGELDAMASSDVNIVNSIGVAAPTKQVNSGYDDSNVHYDYNIYFGTNQIPVKGPHDLVTSPLFINPANRNFCLAAHSPARKSGLAELAPATDLFGHARTAGSIDRGAIQSSTAPSGAIRFFATPDSSSAASSACPV